VRLLATDAPDILIDHLVERDEALRRFCLQAENVPVQRAGERQPGADIAVRSVKDEQGFVAVALARGIGLSSPDVAACRWAQKSLSVEWLNRS
jgi:hypothetical protein